MIGHWALGFRLRAPAQSPDRGAGVRRLSCGATPAALQGGSKLTIIDHRSPLTVHCPKPNAHGPLALQCPKCFVRSC